MITVAEDEQVVGPSHNQALGGLLNPKVSHLVKAIDRLAKVGSYKVGESGKGKHLKTGFSRGGVFVIGTEIRNLTSRAVGVLLCQGHRGSLNSGDDGHE